MGLGWDDPVNRGDNSTALQHPCYSRSLWKTAEMVGPMLLLPQCTAKLNVSFLQSLEHPESLKAGHGNWLQGPGPVSG